MQASSGGVYDDSLYRLLPEDCWAPSCFALSEDEVQREYAVVLDALSGSSCCKSAAQIASESQVSCTSGFYTNWQTCCPAASGQNPFLETCVDETESLCEEEMVSSWTGISGVPGLGYSLPPLQDICAVSQQPQKTTECWSANSAQHLAALRVDLPRVHGNEKSVNFQHHYTHEAVRSRANNAQPPVTNLPPPSTTQHHGMYRCAKILRQNM